MEGEEDWSGDGGNFVSDAPFASSHPLLMCDVGTFDITAAIEAIASNDDDDDDIL